jgi:hypothetical protein
VLLILKKISAKDLRQHGFFDNLRGIPICWVVDVIVIHFSETRLATGNSYLYTCTTVHAFVEQVLK